MMHHKLKQSHNAKHVYINIQQSVQVCRIHSPNPKKTNHTGLMCNRSSSLWLVDHVDNCAAILLKWHIKNHLWVWCSGDYPLESLAQSFCTAPLWAGCKEVSLTSSKCQVIPQYMQYASVFSPLNTALMLSKFIRMYKDNSMVDHWDTGMLFLWICF